jgi:hypothetical protein
MDMSVEIQQIAPPSSIHDEHPLGRKKRWSLKIPERSNSFL